MDILSIIQLVMLLVAVLIIGLAVLMGLKRGFKKSIFRFIWLTLTFVVLMLVSGVITNAIASIDLTALNITIEGESIGSVSDFGAVLVENLNLKDIAVATELIASLPLMLINVILFVLLFWVLKYLLWPFWAILSAVIFRKDRRALKTWKQAGKPNTPIVDGKIAPQKPKLKRGLGALIGLACGLLVCFVTFMPFMGFNSYVNKIQAIEVSASVAEVMVGEENLQENKEKYTLSELLLDEEITVYLDVYDTSVIGTIFTYTGLNALGTATFNGLTQATVAGEKIALDKEIDNVIAIYNEADVLLGRYDLLNADEEDIKNFTQEDWRAIISSGRKILNKALDSKIVVIVVDNYLDDIIEMVAENQLQDVIDNDIEDVAVKIIAQSASDFIVDFVNKNPEITKMINHEVDSLLKVVEVVNNYNLLVPIINGNYSKVVSTEFKLNNPLNDDLAQDFNEFVDYQNTQTSSYYTKGKYLENLSTSLKDAVLNSNIIKNLLSTEQEALVRYAYITLFGEDALNEEFDDEYFNEDNGGYTQDFSIEKFTQLNDTLLQKLNKLALDVLYNYEDIEQIFETEEPEGDEASTTDTLTAILEKIEQNEFVKGALKTLGSIVDDITTSDAIENHVKNDLIAGVFEEYVIPALKEAFNYDELEESDNDRKICDAILNMIGEPNKYKGEALNLTDDDKKAIIYKLQAGKAESLMETLSSSLLTTIKSVNLFTGSITKEDIDNLDISEIGKAIDDLTGEDGIMSKDDIADIVVPVIEKFVDPEDEDSVFNVTFIDEEDGSEKTILEKLEDNIKNNDIKWEEEFDQINDIAKKALEIMNSENGADTTELEDAIKAEVEKFDPEYQGDDAKTSNLITPDMITAILGFLNKSTE